MPPSADRAKEIIEKIWYITVATTNSDGQPWNTPVYSAYDENYFFYWASWKENTHSQNIVKNPKVFLVIYDSTAPEGTGEGVYIQAKASEVQDEKEIEHAMKYLYGRKSKQPRKVEEFLGDYPRRIYKAVPDKAWINTSGDVDGNFVDKRVEISL
ncbi:MAG: hypothetical protein A2855_03050 [Candidatus Liptonbacteria bacterium RIFCSPHIGHO2_01_FULL_57_28]|uniref:Pyridoxamine 5'-phosphate oxidase N-terminal domain-containing protein n=1 Tax=Candidatus Liptonbacteria bacterium RIFCSPHIGHO2_01_FULL_57_28 TaxID=1798647 RepID=A0A1G2C9I3_9BACT|nr:MAG: hypothetical protein A2855_03050 [Candidatus Liptonbacteria bacterium RIFCSPHIGHO2_01_FULL_57_28]